LLQKGTAQYVWDVANRLVRTGDQLYRYDGHGRRTVAATVDALGQPLGASTLTIYSRDGQLLYEERIGANVPAGQIFANGFEPGAAAGESVTLTYHWLGKALVARRETRGAQVGTVWLTTDVLGSVVAETGPTGAVLNRTHYQPFGIASEPRTGPGYTGHVMDPGTSLVYMQGRYYDADVGRFLSMDPVAPSSADGADFNRYAYARNNPYRYTDPDGHYVESPLEAISIAAGVASFGKNVAEGNYGSAAIDAAGVVIDSIAAAVPVAPGVAGIAIQSARAAETVVDAAQTAKSAGTAVDAAAGAGRLWRPSEFQGTRVYQRDDLINPGATDAQGRTNLQRMESGRAPIGPDGELVNLHHTIQSPDGPLAEVSATFHRENSAVLHINPSETPSGIDRSAFREFRKQYWMNRAKDFR
jgi:RHS repeat-associated protein